MILVLAWALVSAAMLLYFFKFLDGSNQKILDSMDGQKKILGSLLAEKRSEELAQKDLEELAKKTLQPGDFFSKDITLVNELKTLESLSSKYNVDMTTSGISGTVSTAAKAKTITPIVTIPYSISINGNLVSVVKVIETLENLSFITNVSNISISAGDKGKVNASMTANFYLKK